MVEFLIGGAAGIGATILWNAYVHPWLSNESKVVLAGSKTEIQKALDAIRNKF